MALSNTGGSGGLGSFGHNARRYCTVARHYSRSSQPAVLADNSALEFTRILRKVMSSF